MNQENQLQIKASDEDLKGRYANMMQVSHTKEEFFLDFFLTHPPVGEMLARIITSPGHLKRIVAAIQDNLKRYEDNFGKIAAAEEPKKPIGF